MVKKKTDMERPLTIMYSSKFKKYQLICKANKYFNSPWYSHLFSNAFKCDGWMVIIQKCNLLIYYNRDKVSDIRAFLEYLFKDAYVGVEYMNELTHNLNNVREFLI